jgi:hypothetical protein
MAHLRELRAWRRLKLRSDPIPATTPWIRKPAEVVISSAAFYQPSGVIGIVAVLHSSEIEDPHLSNIPSIVFVFLFINYNFLNSLTLKMKKYILI